MVNGKNAVFLSLRDLTGDARDCEPDMQTVQLLRKVCAEIVTHISSSSDRSAALQATGSKLETLFFDQKPTQVWYLLEVAYLLLMPAHASVMDEMWEFQVSGRNRLSMVKVDN